MPVSDRASQSKDGIWTLMMYLYQSYVEDKGMNPKEAKATVLKTVQEQIDKFTGNNGESSNNAKCNTIDNKKLIDSINGICKDIQAIKQQLKSVNQPVYLANKVEVSIKELIKKE